MPKEGEVVDAHSLPVFAVTGCAASVCVGPASLPADGSPWRGQVLQAAPRCPESRPQGVGWHVRVILPTSPSKGAGADLHLHSHPGHVCTAHSPPSPYPHPPQENTLVSFATAAKMGADMVEFDAMLTSDGCVSQTIALIRGPSQVPVSIFMLSCFISFWTASPSSTTTSAWRCF